MTQKCLTQNDRDLIASLKSGRTQEQIFNDIAIGIRKSSKSQLSESESKHAARNFISFCQKLIDFQTHKDHQTGI